jgi:uncharacterized surface protein with fasciclin (FAS1) repeats
LRLLARQVFPKPTEEHCMKIFVGAVVVALAVSFATAGCSSDSKRAASDAATTSTTAPARRGVAEAAAYDAQLSTFATALNVSGLLSRVSANGPYTVFAPSNDAFVRLKHAKLTALLSRAGKQQLAKVLEAHIVMGAIRDLKPGVLTTIGGEKLTVARTGDGFTLTDAAGRHARIQLPPLVATNGVVYRIDDVLTIA